jgi:hypothetical protein
MIADVLIIQPTTAPARILIETPLKVGSPVGVVGGIDDGVAVGVLEGLKVGSPVGGKILKSTIQGTIQHTEYHMTRKRRWNKRKKQYSYAAVGMQQILH